MESLIAGVFSGLAQTMIGYPLDTLKVWKQNNSSFHPSVRNLYKGIKYPLIQNPIICGSGFYTNDYLMKKTNNIYISSALAGFVNSIILAPLDYYKIRRQQQLNTNFFHCYKNYSIVASREIPANLVYFSSYNFLKKHDVSTELAGGCAGISSWVCTYPMDTLKTRMQTNVNLSLVNAFKMGNLFQGLTFCIIRAFIVNALGFRVYESTRDWIIKYRKNHHHFDH